MLSADRAAVETDLQSQAVQIKNIEMENIDRYLQAIGTTATLIAGFAVSTVFSDQLLQVSANNSIFQGVTFFFNYTTLGFNFYCVICSTLVSVLGPTYALNGPKGSMHAAVSAMKEERIHVVYAFFAGALSFAMTQICCVWTIMDVIASVVATIVIVTFVTIITTSCVRIARKFKFQEELANINRYDQPVHVSATDFLKGQTQQDNMSKIDAEKYKAGAKFGP